MIYHIHIYIYIVYTTLSIRLKRRVNQMRWDGHIGGSWGTWMARGFFVLRCPLDQPVEDCKKSFVEVVPFSVKTSLLCCGWFPNQNQLATDCSLCFRLFDSLVFMNCPATTCEWPHHISNRPNESSLHWTSHKKQYINQVDVNIL